MSPRGLYICKLSGHKKTYPARFFTQILTWVCLKRADPEINLMNHNFPRWKVATLGYPIGQIHIWEFSQFLTVKGRAGAMSPKRELTWALQCFLARDSLCSLINKLGITLGVSDRAQFPGSYFNKLGITLGITHNPNFLMKYGLWSVIRFQPTKAELEPVKYEFHHQPVPGQQIWWPRPKQLGR